MDSSNPELASPLEPGFGPPLHGYQGDRGETPRVESGPRGLAIAVSREAGSRGASIAQRVGKKIGWQVYHQELLDYIVQEGIVREGVLGALPPGGEAWIEARLKELTESKQLSGPPAVAAQARVILALGLGGQVVLLGRGAGCLLPRESTLHVRIVAPLADRIAYMSQWLRLTQEEAAEQVSLRDRRRAEFIQTHFHRQPADVYQYDLVLNSHRLGEELCVDLIVQAAKAKQAARDEPIGPRWEAEPVG